MTKKLILPPAHGLCPDCLQDNKQTGNNGILIVSYCLHNRAGAVMELKNGIPSGLWKIYTPITAVEFADAISGAVMDVKNMAVEFKHEKIKTFNN